MSMLARYKKQGGFQQLLTLIETSAPSKRDQLLKVIQSEDPGWAAILKTKMITMEKLFAWDPLALAEVTNEMVPRTLAVALHGLPPESLAKATHAMGHMKKREVEQLFSEMKPTGAEIEAARIKVVSKIRELEKENKLNLMRIDPSLSTRDIRVA